MTVLIVGSGKGSWEMRGLQIGGGIGAAVTSAPTRQDWAAADLVVLVKRAALIWGEVARAAAVPIVWDALDFWQQPAENGLSESDARRRLAAVLDQLQPELTIGATEAMADACEGVYLPHQSWTGLEPTPPRDAVSVVGYEGNALYLGHWRTVLEQACARRGWRVVINPPDLREVDIFVALRDGPWNGWMCREWKSGVKLVNAIAAGRPVVTQDTAAFREIDPPGAIVDGFGDLDSALDRLAPWEVRVDAAERCRALAPSYRLPSVADRYRRILEQVMTSCAA